MTVPVDPDLHAGRTAIVVLVDVAMAHLLVVVMVEVKDTSIAIVTAGVRQKAELDLRDVVEAQGAVTPMVRREVLAVGRNDLNSTAIDRVGRVEIPMDLATDHAGILTNQRIARLETKAVQPQKLRR